MRLYLSYRSSDAAIARRLYERAVVLHGASQVIVNPEVHLPPHREMGEYIAQTMAGCDQALILIGPQWTGIDDLGCLRLSPADEPIYSEVTTALAHVPQVVPVLVNGIRGLPAPDDLPDDLHDLYKWPPVVLDEDSGLAAIFGTPTAFHWLRYGLMLDWLRLAKIE